MVHVLPPLVVLWRPSAVLTRMVLALAGSTAMSLATGRVQVTSWSWVHEVPSALPRQRPKYCDPKSWPPPTSQPSPLCATVLAGHWVGSPALASLQLVPPSLV